MAASASDPNAEQIAYWNDEAGARWTTIQRRVDELFGGLTAAAIDSADPRPGESVLDVGCGCGATVLELARRVGSAGHVVGVDVSRPMLDLANERVRAAGLRMVTLHLADAATYPFREAEFELAFSRFGIMFFGDPVTAFANIRRSLRAGGRLAGVVWRPLADNPWFAVPLAAATRYVAPPAPQDPEAPGPMSFADPSRVKRILSEAGFSGIELQRRDVMMKLSGPNELETAAEFATQVGPASRVLVGATAAAQVAAKAAIRDALAEYDGAGGVALPGSVWFVTARAS
ncbi:MAG TPA: class I SAM-dependent methyltransferase [Xanthomonadales bacterium]|nr:class I SAM-dependent methyltransferase [Xanthomonadales bacterium]